MIDTLSQYLQEHREIVYPLLRHYLNLDKPLLLQSDLRISSFAEGNDGEVYVLDFSAGTIHRFASLHE